MIGPLTRELAGICRRAADDLPPGAARDRVAALERRLSEPRVRIAVGGRVNAGKSTLVNALLHQRLAATGATETTTLVTWFRYGHQDRLRLHLTDGSTRLVPAAPGGGIPPSSAGWGVEPGELTHVTVEASNSALEDDHTIIDTPGLDSVSGADRWSLISLADADAVLYVMPHPGEQDVEALHAIREKSVHLPASSTIGVLSRVDVLGAGDDDPWPAAQRIAQRYAHELGGTFADVLPVVGLLAETALGGDFAESDTRALIALSAADRFDVEDALTSADAFRAWDTSPVPAPARERLLRMLGLYGVGVALDAVDRGHRSTRTMLEHLRRTSGIDAVLDRVQRDFVTGADRLRADAATAALWELSWSRAPDPRGALRRVCAELDRVALHPAARRATLADALDDLHAGPGGGPASLDTVDRERMVALATGHDRRSCLGLEQAAAPDEVERAADEQIARWRHLEIPPAPSRRQARIARELCQQLLFTSD